MIEKFSTTEETLLSRPEIKGYRMACGFPLIKEPSSQQPGIASIHVRPFVRLGILS